jgi:uncharacterized Zn finger protein (UPF0148 family)
MTDAGRSEVTVAELTAQGIEALEATCLRCGAEWQPPITFLPPATTLDKIAALMVCPTCGGRDVEIQAPARTVKRSNQ